MKNRRTIKETFVIEGIGIHSGEQVAIKFKPAEPNTGIRFIRTDLPSHPSITLGYSVIENLGREPRRHTSLVSNGIRISTIEHILASLWALSIDDIKIEVNKEECPIMDGSAKDIFNAIKKAGVKEMDVPKKIIEIKEPIFCENNSSAIAIFPGNSFKISCIFNCEGHDEVAAQYLSLDFGDPIRHSEIFERELAPARTFCFEDELEGIFKRGLGKGGNYDNTLVIRKDGTIIKNSLRFKDEFVRHKIVDLIGDLYILGASLRGNILAVKSGHLLNLMAIEKINSKLSSTPKAGMELKPLDCFKNILDINDIKRVLPHRYPFLLVDKIIELEKDKRIVGVKNVTANENFFQGHFPENPVMPGVLIIEAMAQIGGILLLSKPENVGKLAFFMSIDKAKFRKIVIPGDQLVIEAQLLKARSKIAQVAAKATVRGELVSEAQLMFGVASE